jgi:hypothetical protein
MLGDNMNEDDVKREVEFMLNNRKQQKQWMEKEFSQWVYFDTADGKIIGAVYTVGTKTGIWGGRVYLENNMEKTLGQFIDSDWARKGVERYWEIDGRTLLE